MNFFDLHCDTASEIFGRKCSLYENTLAVSLDGWREYDRKASIFAVWTDNKIKESVAYENFFEISEYLKRQIKENEERAVLCDDGDILTSDDDRLKIILSVEGAGLLENDLTRLEALRERGVRVLTLAWQGENNCGGGYDTDAGLTDFGYRVIEECEKIGIIVDVSHMSEKAFWDTVNFAKFPVFASHSNSAALCSHPRNISDTQLRTVLSGGGVVGVNFVGKHLSKAFDGKEAEAERSSVIDTVVSHIVHFVEKGCDKNVCIGSDFDGTVPICGLERVEKVRGIAEYMKQNGASLEFIDDILYQNAFNFFKSNL